MCCFFGQAKGLIVINFLILYSDVWTFCNLFYKVFDSGEWCTETWKQKIFFLMPIWTSRFYLHIFCHEYKWNSLHWYIAINCKLCRSLTLASQTFGVQQGDPPSLPPSLKLLRLILTILLQLLMIMIVMIMIIMMTTMVMMMMKIFARSTLSTWCGSPPYAAPEVFEGQKYFGPEIDVWVSFIMMMMMLVMMMMAWSLKG